MSLARFLYSEPFTIIFKPLNRVPLVDVLNRYVRLLRFDENEPSRTGISVGQRHSRSRAST